MIKLNLISPSQQKNLKLKDIYTKVGNLLGKLAITAVVIAIFLIPIKSSLTILEEQINFEREKILANNKKQTDKITDLNKKVEVLNLIQKESYNWNYLLVELAEIVPSDVAIIQFNGQLNNNKFILQGYAKTRDGYLAFKDKLFESNLFYNLETPLSDILKKEDITFEIKGYFY